MPCSALVAPFWRAPGERHGAPLRYPAIRSATLGIAADTRIPRAAASDRPDTMGRSCVLPGMHWTSARRACGGVCAPMQLRRSDTGFGLAIRNLQRSMRRCAAKLLFWHSPRYACTHPGRTILPCVLDGQTTDAFHFSPVLHALFFTLPRLCWAQSTQVCCALRTSAHTTQYACISTLWVIRGFCASPWPGHSVRGPCFIKTFSVRFCAQPCPSHQDILSGPHALYGLHLCMGCARIVFTSSSHVHLSLVLCFRHRRLWPRTPMHESMHVALQ